MAGGSSEKIRVLLVDDSPLVLVLIKRMLATSGDIEVVGTAANGQEALEKIPELNPDVICSDLNMPVMNG
ncbi:MAG: response regulator, partial [Leptospirales bacterium]